MDISSILPMLLNKNGAENNLQMQTILNAMNGGNPNAKNTNIPPQTDANPMSAILSAMNGGKNGKTPDIATLMNLANMNKKTNKPMPVGFKAIVNIVPNDILGGLIKMLG